MAVVSLAPEVTRYNLQNDVPLEGTAAPLGEAPATSSRTR
jgi:hypothetical protein